MRSEKKEMIRARGKSKKINGTIYYLIFFLSFSLALVIPYTSLSPSLSPPFLILALFILPFSHFSIEPHFYFPILYCHYLLALLLLFASLLEASFFFSYRGSETKENVYNIEESEGTNRKKGRTQKHSFRGRK